MIIFFKIQIVKKNNKKQKIFLFFVVINNKKNKNNFISGFLSIFIYQKYNQFIVILMSFVVIVIVLKFNDVNVINFYIIFDKALCNKIEKITVKKIIKKKIFE